MAYHDLREFLQFLEQKRELARVDVEVDLTCELGAICRKALDVGGEENNKAKVGETFMTSKVILDATKPLDPDYPREVRPPEEVMKRVEMRWKEYGIN
ncbi:MAG: hypothetical protein ACE5JU_13430 [Candidatus Binatia bacterium]